MNTLLRPSLAPVYEASFASTRLALQNDLFTLETEGSQQEGTLPLTLITDVQMAEAACFTLRDMLIDIRSSIIRARNAKCITSAESIEALRFFNTMSVELVCNGSSTGVEQLQTLRNFELLAMQFEETRRTVWETVCRTEIKFNGYT